jgi:phosphate transport system permease protein
MLIATVLAVAPLVSILWTAADRGGAAVVQPSFYTTEPTPACNPGPNVSCSLGGIGPYIVGTLVLLGIAGLIAIPVGILAGIYLSEYGRNRYGRTVSFFTDVMTGLPSILLGVFVFVVFLQYDRDIANSAISGGVALSVLMIPLVTRTTEEALKTVPMSLRESALALGFPKHRVTLRITLGCARNAIVTGTLLATARAGGETAALLMTATGFEYWPHGLGQRIGALPLLIYQNSQFPYANWQEAAWGATLVLLLIMLVISLVARITFRRTASALESV